MFALIVDVKADGRRLLSKFEVPLSHRFHLIEYPSRGPWPGAGECNGRKFLQLLGSYRHLITDTVSKFQRRVARGLGTDLAR